MAGKTVLVLGGGAGGVVAANELRSKLGREQRIVLVDRQTQHLFYPSFLWVMMGWRKPEEVRKGLGLLIRKGIEYVNAEITRIDTVSGTVKTSAGDFCYDYLIVSLGAELAPGEVPGLVEAAHTVYNLEGTVRLRETLKGFSGGRVVVLVSSMPYKCPAAPYETALLLDFLFRSKGLRERVDLSVYTPEPLPMPTAGPVLGNAVKGMLEAKHIPFHPFHKVASVDPEKKELAFDKGEKVQFDLLVAVPPHRSPQVARESGLAGDTGFIPVERNTLKTKADRVYAIGDVAAIKLPGQFQPNSPLMLPKAGVFAHSQAQVVAHNIAAEIKGMASMKGFDGQGQCFLELGGGKAGYATGNFYGEPAPTIDLRQPGRLWHWGKILFEKYWLWRWF